MYELNYFVFDGSKVRHFASGVDEGNVQRFLLFGRHFQEWPPMPAPGLAHESADAVAMDSTAKIAL